MNYKNNFLSILLLSVYCIGMSPLFLIHDHSHDHSHDYISDCEYVNEDVNNHFNSTHGAHLIVSVNECLLCAHSLLSDERFSAFVLNLDLRLSVDKNDRIIEMVQFRDFKIYLNKSPPTFLLA